MRVINFFIADSTNYQGPNIFLVPKTDESYTFTVNSKATENSVMIVIPYFDEKSSTILQNNARDKFKILKQKSFK